MDLNTCGQAVLDPMVLALAVGGMALLPRLSLVVRSLVSVAAGVRRRREDR